MFINSEDFLNEYDFYDGLYSGDYIKELSQKILLMFNRFHGVKDCGYLQFDGIEGDRVKFSGYNRDKHNISFVFNVEYLYNEQKFNNCLGIK